MQYVCSSNQHDFAVFGRPKFTCRFHPQLSRQTTEKTVIDFSFLFFGGGGGGGTTYQQKFSFLMGWVEGRGGGSSLLLKHWHNITVLGRPNVHQVPSSTIKAKPQRK